MQREKLKIVDPCSMNFDEMDGEGHRRFCSRCDKHVHNLSALTRQQATKLLQENRESGLCVVYTFDRSNQIRFRDELNFKRPSKSQLHGLKKLLAAAAVIPLLASLPACDTRPHDDVVIEQVDASTTSRSESFKPIDEIIAAEKRFFRELADLFGDDDVPDHQVLMGAMVMEPDVFEEWDVDIEPESIAPPTSEQGDSLRVEIMGDVSPETIDALQQQANQ